MKIYAPVKDTNGVHASVRFVDGVGETDNPHLIKWFRTHGYGVEEVDLSVESKTEPVVETVETVVEIDTEDEMMGYADKTPRLEDMNPLELREWAKANGKGHLIKNTRNKEKLIEILRG